MKLRESVAGRASLDSSVLVGLALAFVSGLCGCASSQSAPREDLPAAWLHALPPRAADAVDVSGRYVVKGELVGPKLALRDQRPLQSLPDLFFAVDRRLANAHVVELRRPAAGQLHVRVLQDEATLAEATFEASSEPETGALVIRRAESKGATNVPGGFVAANTVRLWKGLDGLLYARLTTRGAGVVVIVPYVDRGEAWGRWEPATPETLARQLAQQEEALQQRAVRRVGESFPDFQLTDLGGRPVSRAQFDGKVVLVLFGSTNLRDGQLLRALRAAQRNYQPRGLEMITFWTQSGVEPGVVARYVEQHALPGAQCIDARRLTNPPSNGRWRAPPYTLVLDRDGRIAAVNPAGDGLDQVLQRLLPGN